MAKHRFAIIVMGLVASAIFVYLAVRHLDFGKVEDALASAQIFPWVPIGIGCYLLGHVVRGQRCRLLVRREANLPLATATNIVLVGYGSNNVFPARLGELVRAGMLAERTGLPVAQSLAITFIERVLDGLAILFLLVVTTLTGDTPGWIQELVRIAVAVFGIATTAIFVGAYSPGAILAIASRIGNRFAPRWHDRLVSLATSITNAVACLRDPRDALMLGFYSLVVWSFDAALFIAILPAFGIPHSLRDGVVAMSVTNLGLLVPSSPGFIGPFHYFCARALTAHGVPDELALAYATLVHLAIYIPVTLAGAAAMLWYGVEVGSTAAIARQARRSHKTTTVRGVDFLEIAPVSPPLRDEPPAAFVAALVEATVGGVAGAADPAAVAATAQFVDGQLKALQPRLRLLFHCGMLLFRFATRLRYLRGYCDVPLASRRVWTERWATSRISLLRQLFKPVRAIALLAYYDHDAVARALLAPSLPAAGLVRKPASAPAVEPSAVKLA